MRTKIIDYGMNGEGIGKVDGKTYFISNALLGEDVEFEINLDKQNYAFASSTEIKQSSPERASPPCPYFYECGGCSLQHMKYPHQLDFKSLLVKKTLKKITDIDLDVSSTYPSKQFKYRNKASFNTNGTNVGFFKKESNDIVNIDYCMLMNDDINQLFAIFKTYLSTLDKDKVSLIKHLVVRAIDHQILVGLVIKRDFECTDFYSQLKNTFSKIGLYKIINNRRDSVVLSGKTIHVSGIKEICINNFNLTYSVDLLGFHQTNIEIQDSIYQKVLELIDPDSIVANGFSGEGLLSGILASKARHVYGIEISPSSHKSAEKLKRENHIVNLTNILGDFNIMIDSLLDQVDSLILDPSKKGCGKEIMNKIIGIKNIIYISCNPIALAKDLRFLTKYYIIDYMKPFDMFPNTNSVETLIHLKLKKEK